MADLPIHATLSDRVHDEFLAAVPEPKPAVHVVGAGGTIAKPIDAPGVLSTVELIEELPVLEDVANITTHDVTADEGGVRSRSGYVRAFRDRHGPVSADPVWFDFHDHVRETVSGPSPPDGIVITHGSNTVEETAYFLSLTLPRNVPVVLTAAQRWHGMLGADGPWNLLTAVHVAGNPDASGRGAFLVLDDQLHASRAAMKVESGRPGAWRSGEAGLLGRVDKLGHVRFDRDPPDGEAEAPFDVTDVSPAAFPHVDVVYSVAGADGRLVEAAVDRGADGIVLAALPTGDPAATQRAAVDRAVEAGIPVVVSHRGTHGWVSREHMDGPDGVIWGSDLRPPKARVLLGLSLLETEDPAELQRSFLEY